MTGQVSGCNCVVSESPWHTRWSAVGLASELPKAIGAHGGSGSGVSGHPRSRWGMATNHWLAAAR